MEPQDGRVPLWPLKFHVNNLPQIHYELGRAVSPYCFQNCLYLWHNSINPPNTIPYTRKWKGNKITIHIYYFFQIDRIWNFETTLLTYGTWISIMLSGIKSTFETFLVNAIQFWRFSILNCYQRFLKFPLHYSKCHTFFLVFLNIGRMGFLLWTLRKSYRRGDVRFEMKTDFLRESLLGFIDSTSRS